MRPTLLTGLLLLFCLICFIYAWMMNSAEAAAAGLGLLVFVFLSAGIFQTNLRSLALSVNVVREADRTVVDQNGMISITSSITAVTGSLTASFDDVLPPGSVLISGSPVFAAGRASYRFRLPVIGTSCFQGVRVSCRDMFFTQTLLIARGAELPKLTMYPTGIAATHHAVGHGSGWSSVEFDRPALITGYDTRTLRPYADGDSLRNIDWKLSGKHDQLYVRLKMDASGGLPALIVDLPRRDASEELRLHFAETVVGVLESLRIGEEYPVIFINGASAPEIIRSAQSSMILEKLREAENISTSEHLFRLRHPSSLARETFATSRDPTKTELRISEITRKYAGREPTVFELEMRKVSAEMTKETHITYVTAALGDLSHMTYLINETKKNDRYAMVFVVGAAGTPREAKVRTAFTLAGADSVEMV
ncbi:hypothetical protein SDC9_32694 [bioreactor metagenome]|uniref:Uncharacterized protein n=1 Tax=bioreactor metagenome TaxID=1076179 RepID=A0A644V5T9_9ZZZZ|nr:DUF58 domain-containing protein [Methanocorpusculum sp.]